MRLSVGNSVQNGCILLPVRPCDVVSGCALVLFSLEISSSSAAGQDLVSVRWLSTRTTSLDSSQSGCWIGGCKYARICGENVTPGEATVFIRQVQLQLRIFALLARVCRQLALLVHLCLADSVLPITSASFWRRPAISEEPSPTRCKVEGQPEGSSLRACGVVVSSQI